MGKLTNLYGVIGSAIVALLVGYGYSRHLQDRVTEVWKQALWEDRANRMGEINAVKTRIFTSSSSSDIKIVTEKQTLQLKESSTKSLNAEEKDFLADQIFLSLENPVKTEKLDSLFRERLKEHDIDLKTAVILYQADDIHNKADRLPGYRKLDYKVNIGKEEILEGYVKGNYVENILWGKSYYLFLTLLLLGASGLWVWDRRRSKFVPENDRDVEASSILSSTMQEPELSTLYLNEQTHLLIYAGTEIPLAPKVFHLFYLLSKGNEYFQPHDFLLQNYYWCDKIALVLNIIKQREFFDILV